MDFKEEINVLEKRIEALEQAIAAKTHGKKRGNQDRFNALNDVDIMIKDAIENQKHPILEHIDLVYSDRLMMILEGLYPNIPYFNYTTLATEYYGRSDAQIHKVRSLGARLRKLGYRTIKARYYAKPEDGGTTNRCAWVLRNHKNYHGMQDKDVAVCVEGQWEKGMKAYNESVIEVTFK